MEPVPTLDDYLACIVHLFLTKNERRLCLFEEVLASRTDPTFPSPRIQQLTWLTYNSEIFYILAPQDNDATILETIKKANAGWYFLCIMADPPANFRITIAENQVTDDQLRILAEHAEKIVVGAYDREGYLIWQRGTKKNWK